MNGRHPYVVVFRRAIPLWLLLVIAPLGVVFLTSLVLALALVGIVTAVAAFVLPRRWRRPPVGDGRTIELDASQYRHLPGRRDRDER